jgi:hypothetical protein
LPKVVVVMPVLAGPTPLRCALKSNRGQSPFTAAVAACPPPATNSTAHAPISARKIDGRRIKLRPV